MVGTITLSLMRTVSHRRGIKMIAFLLIASVVVILVIVAIDLWGAR